MNLKLPIGVPIVVIYHGNCADGFGAAWVVREYLKQFKLLDTTEFHAGVYQTEPPNCAGKVVIMVDFSYKRPVMDLILGVCNKLLVLDHHKTAKEDLESISSEKAEIVFDMSRSGALIAWEYFFPDRPVLDLILTIDDRDRWQFKRSWTREIQAAVFSYPYDFDTWSGLMHLNPTILRTQGEAIEQKHFKDIHELLKVTTRLMLIGEQIVPVANLPYTMSSDAGHILCEQNPERAFAACYWDIPGHKTVFSLRSAETGADVSAIAKMYGGGGHAHAAGFTVHKERVIAEFELKDQDDIRVSNSAEGSTNT